MILPEVLLLPQLLSANGKSVCPYNKKCFVCKTETEVSGNVVVLHKCMVTKEDIPVQIGKEENACVL